MAPVALDDLAAQINELHGLVADTLRLSLQYARNAGELLLEVKARLPHGQLIPWVKANCTVAARQAQRYMRLAEEWPRLLQRANASSGTHFDDLTLSQALALLSEPKVLQPAPRDITSRLPDTATLIAAKRAQEPYASRIAAVHATFANAKARSQRELDQTDREIAGVVQREGAVVDLTPCDGLTGDLRFFLKNATMSAELRQRAEVLLIIAPTLKLSVFEREYFRLLAAWGRQSNLRERITGTRRPNQEMHGQCRCSLCTRIASSEAVIRDVLAADQNEAFVTIESSPTH